MFDADDMPVTAVQALAARYGLTTASAPAKQQDQHALIPVAPPLSMLLAAGGLRRGSVLTVTGSLYLALALLSEASAAGAWSAVVGVPGLGAAAVAGAGIALDRLAVVPEPGPDWPDVVAVLLDAVQIVVVRPGGRLAPVRVRRLAGRVRERGAVLIVLGAWEGAEVALSVVDECWEGLGAGHGRLRARQVQVRTQGKGAAGRVRQTRLWLPDSTGGVGAAVPEAA